MKTANLVRNQAADLHGNKSPDGKTDNIDFLTLCTSDDVICQGLKVFS